MSITPETPPELPDLLRDAIDAIRSAKPACWRAIADMLRADSEGRTVGRDTLDLLRAPTAGSTFALLGIAGALAAELGMTADTMDEFAAEASAAWLASLASTPTPTVG